MRALRNLVLFIVAGLVALLVIGWVSGFFFRANVEVKEVAPFVAVYADYQGAYSETNLIQEQLYDILWEAGIENFKNFGIYYDDPQVTPNSDLRSKVGRVIQHDQVAMVKQLSEKYKLFFFENQKAAVVETPYSNLFSVYAGVYKAYPLLKEYAENNGYEQNAIIEIQDIPHKIIFVLPLKSSKVN